MESREGKKCLTGKLVGFQTALCHRLTHSRPHARKQLCHTTVTPEARSSCFIADSREVESSTLTISNEQLQYISLKKNILIYPVHSLPTLISCSLHSSSQWAAHGAEVNTDVSLCLQAKAAVQRNFSFSESNKSPHLDLHHHVWPCLQSVPHAGSSDTKFPSLRS